MSDLAGRGCAWGCSRPPVMWVGVLSGDRWPACDVHGLEYQAITDRANEAAARLAAAEEECARHDPQAALDRVEALCARWDAITKGESGTTAAIRAAVRGD